MKMKRFMALLLVAVLSLGTVCGVETYAAEDNTQSITESGTKSAEVEANVASNFTVTIPKKVSMTTKEVAYEVSVTGDLRSDESIKVTPDATFKMSDKEISSRKKSDVTATVSQDKTEWMFDETELKGSGTITADGLSAGIWGGVLNFKIVVGDDEGQSNLAPGLYDENDNLIVSWAESGIDVETDYTEENFKTSETSGYYVTQTKYPDTRKVVISDSVTSIGEMAFLECTGLTSVVIPDSVTSIGGYAFGACMGLTSVVIPDSVTAIEASTFAYCSSLTSVVIPDSVTTIGKWAFFECTVLTSVVIPDSVTSIGGYAFNWCESLTSVVIPDSVTTIGEYAFSECTVLTSVEFKDTETWYVGESEGATETEISSSDLADKSTAATYLEDTYSEKYWTKQ